jgi:hypothetical protein
MGAIIGALGFSMVWPYDCLVGASPGVYSLIGACLSLILFGRSLLSNLAVVVTLAIMLLVQIGLDLLLFALQYSPVIAYCSHFFGAISGFLVMTLLLLSQNVHKNVVLIFVTLFALTIVTGSLVAHYLWEMTPPVPVTIPFFRNHGSTSNCCASMNMFLNSFDMDKQTLLQYSSCNDQQFHYWGSDHKEDVQIISNFSFREENRNKYFVWH